MNQTAGKIDPQTVARVRRRMGFIAILWWIAAIAGSLGLAQFPGASLGRKFLVILAWLMAIFLSYAWNLLRKEPTQ